MNISFVGAGNVAWHLAQAFENAGHIICEVYSRDPQNARLLVANLYDSMIQPDLNFSESAAALIILAVADDALEEVMERIVFPSDVMVVNTSGIHSLESLHRLTEVYSDVPVRTGVFYPLQTFSKAHVPDYSVIPFCVEADDRDMEDLLVQLAHTISKTVYRMDSEERRFLHLTATFANNFTNHMLAVAHDLLESKQMDFELLKPLVEQTFRKALLLENPADGQTGVARRGDWEMIRQHLSMLQDINPEWAQLYHAVTESIRGKYH